MKPNQYLCNRNIKLSSNFVFSGILQLFMNTTTFCACRALTTGKVICGCLIAMALNLVIPFSANSQGYVSFDRADSNVSAGLYCFLFSGVTTDIGAPYQLSGFTLSGFTALGNTQSLVAVSSPDGWPSIGSDTDAILYELAPFFNNNLNGLFEVSATPNLVGNVNWSFSFYPVIGSPVPTPLSGTISIDAVPEPSSFALTCITIIFPFLYFIRRMLMEILPTAKRVNVNFPRWTIPKGIRSR